MLQLVLAAVPAASGPPGASDGFSWRSLVIVVIVFAVAYPLQAWLRRTVSDRRRARWRSEDRGRGDGP